MRLLFVSFLTLHRLAWYYSDTDIYLHIPGSFGMKPEKLPAFLLLFPPFFVCLTFPSFLFFSELVDAARKALISRVEELTNDRSAVKLELTSSQETASHLETRMKEMEQETKRYTAFLNVAVYNILY